jgi:hypothetical protein
MPVQMNVVTADCFVDDSRQMSMCVHTCTCVSCMHVHMLLCACVCVCVGGGGGTVGACHQVKMTCCPLISNGNNG